VIIVGTGPVDQVAVDILRPFADIVISRDPGEESVLFSSNGASALIIRGAAGASARLINSARELRVIGRTGAGYETVDVKAATAWKIPVVYAPGASSRAVAEAAVTYILALCKRLYHWDTQVKAGNWNSRYGTRPGDMEGATLGIIGLGRIGQTLAELVRPFGMTVLAFDPLVPPERVKEVGAELTTLTDLLQRSDFLSLHAPLTPETRGMINHQTMQSVKRGAYLINLARGGLIESLDLLLEALESGALAGVGLDVFEPEPPDHTHPLFKHPGLLTSPHSCDHGTGNVQHI
jgi:D-3-phosphoglycerate dehydrogenase